VPGYSGTRAPVSVGFDNLEVGASIAEIMEWFHLSHEQILSVIEFAARSHDVPPPMPPAGAAGVPVESFPDFKILKPGKPRTRRLRQQ